MIASQLDNKRNPIFLLLSFLSLIFIIAPLYQQGLFIDGLLYKTVATNYYLGEATFWKMKFNDLSMNPFYEQPPFFFFLSGAFYKVFGNSFLAGNFFTLFLLLLSAFLVIKICRLLFRESFASEVILLLLLCIPVLCWSFANQVIETLVLPLSLLATVFFLKYQEKACILRVRLFYLFGFSLLLLLLFLTKGFQSCFIILLPFLYYLFFRKRHLLIFTVCSSLVFFIALYFLLVVHAPSAEWFSHYFQKRLLASINQVGATTSWRAEIIFRTFTELLIPFMLVAAVLFYVSIKKLNVTKVDSARSKIAWIFLLIGLSGSVPFAITLEQRGFYLVPAFPFFIISLVLFFGEQLFILRDKIYQVLLKPIFKHLLRAAFVLAIFYWLTSPLLFKRDKERIQDLSLMLPYIQHKDTLSADEPLWNDIALQAYLYLHKQASLQVQNGKRLLIHDRNNFTATPENYIKLSLPTSQYDLFVLHTNAASGN